MDDEQIADEVDALEREESALRREEAQAGDAGRADVVERDAGRIEEIRRRLAQLEDLKRRREAARNAGQPVDEVEVRSPEQIEGYLG